MAPKFLACMTMWVVQSFIHRCPGKRAEFRRAEDASFQFVTYCLMYLWGRFLRHVTWDHGAPESKFLSGKRHHRVISMKVTETPCGCGGPLPPRGARRGPRKTEKRKPEEENDSEKIRLWLALFSFLERDQMRERVLAFGSAALAFITPAEHSQHTLPWEAEHSAPPLGVWKGGQII